MVTLKIISVLLLLVLSTIGYFLKDLPKLYREMAVENRRASNNMELQREVYFREIGGKELSNTFNKWLGLFMDDKEINRFKRQQAIDLITKTVIYGSARTVNISANYMKHVFLENTENNSNHGGDELSYYSTKNILYFAYIISSLKFDFTGYEIDPLHLLEIKINDFSEIKETETFKMALRDIKKEIN